MILQDLGNIVFYAVFIVHVKTDGIYKDTEKDVEITFGTSNFELDRPLPKGKKINWNNEK